MPTYIPSAQRNRAADAVTARANGGNLIIYGGTVPADADAALSGNAVAATLPMGNPAFGAAVDGVATANAIATAQASATVNPVTFFRVVEPGGAVVFQAGAGLSGSNEQLILSSLSFVQGGNVGVSALTYTQAKT